MTKSGKIIGIDLGTTYSAAAVFSDRQGKYVIIRSRTGTSTTPSVVGYREGQIVVGEAAKKRMATDPDNTIAEIKRHMGEPFRDENKQAKLGADRNPIPYTVRFAGKDHSPQMISAYILKDIKEQAEELLGEPVTGAVITVPAYFEEAARRATKEAGSLAGLEVKCLVSEPTAAAIAFGMDQKPTDDDEDEPKVRRILVYDLGGGTFDVSIIEIRRGDIEVKGTDGDHYLGGIDFDRAVVEWIVDRIKADHGIDLRHGDTPDLAKMYRDAYNRIFADAEKIKIALSVEASTQAAFPYLFLHNGSMVNIEYTLTRGEFLVKIGGLLKKTMATVDRALAGANMRKEDIEDVILVGGSTRIPKIRELLEKHFGKAPRTDVHPDEGVALGAAMQALRYAETGGASPEMVAKIEEQLAKMGHVIDITAHSLGVREGENNMSVLIAKNSPIPESSENTYQTAVDHQRTVQVAVYQGEDPRASNNTLLTKFELTDLPPMPAGDVRIKIRFTLDVNGVLNVEATNLIDGKSASISTKYGGATSTRPEDLVANTTVNAPPTRQGTAIPAEMQDTWQRARDLLPKLEGSQRNSLDVAMKGYMESLARGDRKAIGDRADALMDTLFEVMPL